MHAPRSLTLLQIAAQSRKGRGHAGSTLASNQGSPSLRVFAHLGAFDREAVVQASAVVMDALALGHICKDELKGVRVPRHVNSRTEVGALIFGRHHLQRPKALGVRPPIPAPLPRSRRLSLSPASMPKRPAERLVPLNLKPGDMQSHDVQPKHDAAGLCFRVDTKGFRTP